ncbi:potassium transporter KtrB [Blautia schinkii]|nr:potassium transporter KtrB [Blautia schinkii]
MLQKLNSRLQKLNTAQIITLGFAGVIFIGGIILWLPFCTAPGEYTSFTDAMFTATTCVCVTGLVTVVTAAHWTIIGKVVILILIQIGGIGLISLASIIFIGLHRKISLRERRMIQESYNLDKMAGLVKLVRRVIISVFGAEAIGAVCYAFCFVPEFGLAEGLAQSVFTAVSAFCNAGIDILGENSLASYVDNPLVNLTTMGLIIAAGLGFVVWWDVADKIKRVLKRQMPLRRAFKSLRLHSKIVLAMTAILVLGGTVFIFLFEYGNPNTIKDMPLGTKVLASAFQSVTTRTAGFFTVDQAAFSNASVILCLVLMFIGGSPMGTAGGVKTTTMAVMFLSVLSNLRGRRDVESHHRRIRDSYIRSAVVVTGMGFMTLLVMTLLLAAAMPGAGLVDILYEMTSAIATVGLSRGLTPTLSVIGKWIVILTMYLGRIGPLTLGTAVVIRAHKRTENTHLAEEDVMIG